MSNRFTPTQGRYLSFIYYYTLLNDCAPSEREIAEYLGVSPPAAHQMVVSLAKYGLVERAEGDDRSVRVLVPPDDIPRPDGRPGSSQGQTLPTRTVLPGELVNPKELISLQDAAAFSGYSPQRLRALAMAGKFRAWHIGNSWITTRQSVQQFIDHDTERRLPRRSQRRS